MLDERELRELAAQLGAALAAVHAEIEQLEEIEIALPAEIVQFVRERDALSATLRWLTQTHPRLRGELEARYRLERGRLGQRVVDGVGVPVMDSVKRVVADGMEQLGRAGARDHELRRELIYAPVWPGWWWI